ncbi:histidine phosphatase family protein [Paracoccus laeviglucosivorans]|uniref:histidine phosphatase family protein n=1 Tax=Paracoccus laeviglucosivorans TaxID=1197861 RepID=UPI00163DE162|nr:histidine phosphatase family protein [Paracoccus laeviglucosivorans]
MSLLDHAEFYFLRHGQTQANADSVLGGWTDLPLTDLGLRQARDAALRLGDVPISGLHVSPLIRAYQTAEAVLTLRPDLPMTPAPLLRERNWGVWEGQPTVTLRREATLPEGEGPEEFRTRIRAGLAGIPSQAAVPVLIVAHSGTAREIYAALRIPFQRPANCALLRFSRPTAGHGWQVQEI